MTLKKWKNNLDACASHIRERKRQKRLPFLGVAQSFIKRNMRKKPVRHTSARWVADTERQYRTYEHKEKKRSDQPYTRYRGRFFACFYRTKTETTETSS